MKNAILFLSVIIISVSFSSCKKKCSAGKGGEVTIAAQLKHHTTVVPNTAGHLDTVYLKFNTQDGDSNLDNYDTYFVGDAGEDHVHLEGLKCGDYYIYGVGYDIGINERAAFLFAGRKTHRNDNYR